LGTRKKIIKIKNNIGRRKKKREEKSRREEK
jgi:hypothetical protein